MLRKALERLVKEGECYCADERHEQCGWCEAQKALATPHPIGKISEGKKLFLREEIGEAESNGNVYRLMLINGNMPCVENSTSKKRFFLDWESIIQLAQEAGID